MNAKKRGPSKMAEGIALHRVSESQKPEGERILYDPYAIRFVNPDTLAFAASHPEEARVMLNRMNRLFPGLDNSIRARVRYFDDLVKRSVEEGLEQLVIMGAGYDTRAYRIAGLEQLRVFEVDHPDTQDVKMARVREIFGSLPGHVTYVPVDFETEKLGPQLLDHGYDRSRKTLFVMEGLVMYIPPGAIDETLSFIAHNSGKGSAIIFDYYPRSVVDGTGGVVGRNIREYVIKAGEPLLFGLEEGTVESFLTRRGFTHVRDVNAAEYKRLYFHGVNENRQVCDLLYFAHAEVG